MENDIKNFIVKPCDIFFTRGKTFLSTAIRIFGVGDDHKAKINHVGIVIEEGPINKANVIEALTKVKKHTIFDQYHNTSDKICIFRPLNLTQDESNKIIEKALSYENYKYGYLKLVTHFLDFFTGGNYIFRRLTNSDNYPICSWVVAHSYKAADKNFGCDACKANPDHIWDFCVNNPDKYSNVFQLQRI